MSKELAKTYDPKGIEDRLYEKWMNNKYFHAEVDHSKTPFTIVIPPPNITGQLHMGHALDNTMQDILIRFKRMQGFSALWLPGTDHASIATEVKVVEKPRAEGQVSFVNLFEPSAPRGEIIATFLALLELLRQHRVIVYQNAAFHEITILPSKETPEDAPLERPDDYE